MPDFPVAAQHQRTIEKITDLFAADPRYLALIVGGSVAKGRAKASSDVDVTLVVTEEEYARRAPDNDLVWFDATIGEPPCEYAEGKIVDLQFLRDVADHGSEPARAAYKHAFIIYSHIPELPELLRRIMTYPESEQAAKMRGFFSEIEISRWYIGEAEKRDNRYLLTHFTANIALFGGRLILAHNKILYPYHKWFIWELEHAPEKPDGFMALFDAVVAQPGSASAKAFYDAIVAFRDWGVSREETNALWVKENEWTWREHRPALADW